MFVSASTRCFSDRTFAEACTQITDLEYDRLELFLDENGHLKPSEVAVDPEAFVSHYRELTRLTPISICLAHDIPASQFSGISKLAKIMRITQVAVPASPLGTPFNAEIDRLKALVAAANSDGVRVSIETENGRLSEDPHTAVELCQAVRGLGLALDPSEYLCGPHRNASYDQVFPYVWHLHLRDSTPEQLQVQVGLGEIDYSRLINQLRRFDYNGALSVEIFPEQLGGIDRSLEMRKLRMLLDSLL